MRPKTSILHNKEKMLEVTSSCNSIKECLEALGLRAAGGNYKQFHLSCKELGITPPSGIGDVQTLAARLAITRPLEDILVENSTYGRSALKRRLIKLGILKEVCYECGISPTWKGKPLGLIIDHINGVYNDNRLENLRLLCPNCNSQTATFCGKNFQSLCQCGNKKLASSIYCRICSSRQRTRTSKIDWPDDKELLERLQTTSYRALGQELGVSDNAIRKRLKRNS